MNDIADEYRYIFAVIIFYGFLFTLYVLNGNQLFGLEPASMEQALPSVPTGNWITDFLGGAVDFIGTIWGFFNMLLINPFIAEGMFVFGFINWAIFGTTLYLLIRMIRGGG